MIPRSRRFYTFQIDRNMIDQGREPQNFWSPLAKWQRLGAVLLDSRRWRGMSGTGLRKLDSANEQTAVSDPTSPQKVINFQCNIVLHVCLLLKYKPNKKMRWSAPCYCTPPLVSLGWDNLWALVVPPLKRLSFFHSTDSLSDPLPNN